MTRSHCLHSNTVSLDQSHPRTTDCVRSPRVITGLSVIRLEMAVAILFLLCASALSALAVDLLPAIRLCSERAAGRFPLVENGKAAALVYSKEDAEVVATAEQALAADIKAVTHIEPVVVSDYGALPKGPCLMAGTLGHSPLIDRMVKDGKVMKVSIASGCEGLTTARWRALLVCRNGWPCLERSLQIRF